MRTFAMVVIGFLAVLASMPSTGQESCLFVRADDVGMDRLLSFQIEVGELGQALGAEVGPTGVPPMRATLEQGDQQASIPMQVDRTESGTVNITLLSPSPATDPRFRVSAGQPDPSTTQGQPSLVVREEEGRVIVNNGYAEVTHDPRKEGGLPSRVVMLKTGKTFEGFEMHDRLYDPGTGQFFLRQDAEAKVRVLRRGPFEAVVETTSRYIQGTGIPGSAPRATYTFTYRVGSPAICVHVVCTQDRPFEWSENHVMEWNFPDRSLKTWVGGTPRQSGTFSGDEQTANTNRWGALTDGESVFGLACSNVKFYSGTGTYGGYIHGPWQPWAGTEQTVDCVLWLDSEPGALDRLEKDGVEAFATADVHVSTPQLESLRESVTKSLDALPVGPLRGVHRWWSSLITRRLYEQARISGAIAALTAQSQAIQNGAAVDAVLATATDLANVGLVQKSDELLVAWGKPEERCSPASLFSLTHEREFLSGKPGAIWRLSAEAPDGKGFSWDSQSRDFVAETAGTPTAATISWVGRGDAQGLRVTVTSTLSGSQCKAKLSIANDSDQRSVLQFQFPVLSLGPIGATAEDDVVLQPIVSGKLGKAPLLNGLNFSTDYPSGWGPLQFTAQWDADCGIYMGAHDPFASTKNMKGNVKDGQKAVELAIEWPAPDASKPGNDFEQPGEAVIAAFQGDWFDACQIYRAWAEQEAQWWPFRGQWGRPDTPQWMREICVWAQTGGKPEEVVGPVKKFAEFMGVPTALHWYSWHEIPFDNDYPHYFPTKPGFAEGVAQLQAAGVRVMPYINGRLWDSDLPDFQTTALPAATKGRDGKYYIERYGSGQDLVPMCPTQKVWSDTVQQTVLRLIGPECNVDGVYIDQIAAASPRLCFDASHGHPLSGGHWWTEKGYWPMITNLQSKMAAQFPEKMITTECSAEPYLQCFDAYLTWHYQVQDAVPAVAAVCSGKILFFGRAYNGNDQLAHRMKNAQALVFGEQLGWGPPGIVDTNPDTAAHLRRCARIRHALLPYLADGRMMRPPKVVPKEGNPIPDVTADWAWSGTWNVTDSALQRGAWQAEDGSVAFVFANSTDQPLNFMFEADGTAYGLKSETLSMEQVQESARTALDAVPNHFQREMTIGPLDVVALVVKGG